jgi:hypothetical protein
VATLRHAAVSSTRTKGLDGVLLAFLHARGLTALDNGHRLAGVDAVRLDRVAVQILNRFHGVSVVG